MNNMRIDFREIPSANRKPEENCSSMPDAFELFARDFFKEVLYFEIIFEPTRGADGGKDIIAEEHLSGSMSNEKIRWLISCKHFAHSGKSVNDSDEQNILDRVRQHEADGFIGFYSTITSSGLGNRLDSYKSQIKVNRFDAAMIESKIIETRSYELVKRYFPSSYKNMHLEEDAISIIANKYIPLPCCICGKDLLKSERYSGNLLLVTKMETNEIIQAVVSCKSYCTKKVEERALTNHCRTPWVDISDLGIPSRFLREVMGVMNNLYNKKVIFTDKAFTQYKEIIIAISQLVFRQKTEQESERISVLEMFL
jgi:hypothetical protein